MPLESKSSRKLAAILFADIAGYTAMMQKSEPNALSILKRYQEALSNWTQQHNGEIVKNYGDGSICLFSSAAESVLCAIDLQEELRKQPVVPLRIGLHEGDVVYADNDVYGDAINVASRIESMGVAGNVLLSRTLAKKVKNQDRVSLKSLGSFDFKNVEEPIEVFAIANDGFIVPARKELKGKFEEEKVGLSRGIIGAVLIIGLLLFGFFTKGIWAGDKNLHSGEKSIAVLPFDNLSNNEEVQYFCDGVSRNIINNLSVIPDFMVIPYNSVEQYKTVQASANQIGSELGVEYLVDGFVERLEDMMAINVSLIDASRNKQIWSSGRMQRTVGVQNLFDIQNEITKEIAEKLKTTILPEIEKRIDHIPTQDQVAYDYYLQGVNFYKQTSNRSSYEKNKELTDKSQLFYELALERDSTLAEAYLGLADIERSKMWSSFLEENFLDSALLLVNRAIDLNPSLSTAYKERSDIYFNRGDQEMGEEDCKKAYELNPNDPNAIFCLYNISRDKLDIPNMIDLLKEMEKRLVGIEHGFDMNQPLAQMFFWLGDFELLDYYTNEMQKKDSTRSMWQTSFSYILRGDFDKSIETYETADVEENQAYLLGLGTRYIYNRDYEIALEYFNKWEELAKNQDIDSWQATHDMHRYGYALLMTGNEERGKELLNVQLERYQKEIELKRDRYAGSTYDMAGIYCTLGELEKSLFWLEKMTSDDMWHQTGAGALDYFLKIDPQFDNLRNDPRFQTMVNQITRHREKKRLEARVYLGIEEVLD